MTALRFIAILALALLCPACASRHEHIPTYSRIDTPAALHILAARSQSVRTISAQGYLTLGRAHHESVRLDTALAMQPPSRLRLRAWKFSQAVFDLTLTESGIWLIAPPDANLRQLRTAKAGPAEFAKIWALFTGSFFTSPDLTVLHESPFTVSAPLDLSAATTQSSVPSPQPAVSGVEASSNATVQVDIDRATLTPRRYRLFDPEGHLRFTLTLDHYVDHAGIVYPHHLLAIADGNKIELDLTDVELNGELPAASFKPPRRAEKLQ